MIRRLRRSPFCRLSAGGAVVSMVAVALLGVTAAFTPAKADVDVPTESVLTVNGRQGEFDDFRSLRITVSKTRGLTNEAISIRWTGARPTPLSRGFSVNSLQVMQCWGDPATSDTLAFRETCQFGAGVTHPFQISSARNDAGTFMELRTVVAGDPLEPPSSAGLFVPFRAATNETSTGDIEDLRRFYNAQTTNEAPFSSTAADGTGRLVFEVQTALESTHLGCGRAIFDNLGQAKPQPCALVIVPRGEHDQITGEPRVADGEIFGSALSASLWANRIVVPLEFEPILGLCELGGPERSTVGSELALDAAISWANGVCAQDGPVVSYAAVNETNAIDQLLSADDSAPGMAIVFEPVTPGEGRPPIVHAPVALTGVAIAFNIDVKIDGTSSPLAPLEATAVRDISLTPRLAAKLLTQSYTRGAIGLAEVRDMNPATIRLDPEFYNLNPLFKDYSIRALMDGVLLPSGTSAAATQMWQWILADPEARLWLSGQPDENGMQVNPAYLDLPLASGQPLDTFPRADQECRLVAPPDPRSRLCSSDIAPYVDKMRVAAQRTLRDDSRSFGSFNPVKFPVPGFDLALPDPLGVRWAMSVTALASAERYGLYPAKLRNRAGQFVAPTTESLLAALNARTPSGVAGVDRIDPTRSVPDGYPLAMLGYAAMDHTDPIVARQEYSTFLRYAVTSGQVPGESAGQLPGGYAPLPEALRNQAVAAANTILTPPPTPSPTATPSPTQTTSPPSTSTAGTSTSTTAAATPRPSLSVITASASPRSTRTTATVSALTPSDPVGPVRFVLIGVLGLGLAAVFAGPVMAVIGGQATAGPGRKQS